MNDTELDELLNTWKAPALREPWRESVRQRIARPHRKTLRDLLPSWKLLVAGTSAAAIVLMLASTSAFSRRLSPPPYTVDSEIRYFLPEKMPAENIEGVAPGTAAPGTDRNSVVSRDFHYALDPLLTTQMFLVTSYNDAGSEQILSTSIPDQPFKSFVAEVFLVLFDAAEGFKRRFILTPDEEAAAFAVVYPSSPRSDQAMILGRREILVSSGCRTSLGNATVVGQAVLMGYPVTVVQWSQRGRTSVVTLWMAPELSCFALRATIHEKQSDGTWRLISHRHALSVTANR